MRAINASIMRKVNRTLILNRIRMRPISRAELAEETGLTRASVTQIVEELINDGMVMETSMVERSRLGRRSTQLAVNPEAGCLFGVMIQPRSCSVGATDMLGRVLAQNLEITDGRKPGEVLDAVARLIEAQIRSLSASRERVSGVGVSVPGRIDVNGGMLPDVPLMEEWNGVNLRTELEARTGLSICVESAADALALEQKYFGGAGESFALLRMEETLSVGVVVGDALYRGAPEFPVELGRCPAGPDGGRTLNQLLTADGSRSWRAMLDHPEDPENQRMLLQLSYPLAGAMCAYRVNRAMVGGALGKRMLPLLPRLQERVRDLLPQPAGNAAEVAIAETDPVRMAAAAAYHRIFSV